MDDQQLHILKKYKTDNETISSIRDVELLFFKVFRNNYLKQIIFENNQYFNFELKTSKTLGSAFYFINKIKGDIDTFHSFTLTANEGQVGLVNSNNKIPFYYNLKINFQFSITSNNNCGGDGFAIVFSEFLNKEVDNKIRGGEYLGFNGSKGLIAIEFDTYQNGRCNDPNGNHISIQGRDRYSNLLSSNHRYSIASITPPSTTLNDGMLNNVEILYNKDESTISLLLDSIQLFNKVYIPSLKNKNKLYISFTSATGLYYSNHSIFNCQITKQ